MANTKANQYVPGVCNIGEIEATNRRKMAMNAAVVTILLWASLLILGAPTFAFVLVALPGFVAATAYMQSKQRFCAGFGAEGLYNFSDELGKTQKAANADDRAKDKKKAISITVNAALAGTALAAVAAGTSLLV